MMFHIGQVEFVQSFMELLIFFCLLALSVIEDGMLKSPLYRLVYSPFSFVNFHFIYFDAILLNPYRFRPILFSWWTNPIIIIVSPSLCLVVFLP